jgi:heptaprenyl diphosphate synthase
MSTRDIARIGLLGAAAVVLFIFESLAPRPLPWMKLGLGNLPVVLGMSIYGPPAALAISLLNGAWAGPSFFIGGGAGLCSWLLMAMVWYWGRPYFSEIGLSIWGALAHQVSQLALAYIYIGQVALFSLLPLALLSALLSGILIGLLAHWLCLRWPGEGL